MQIMQSGGKFTLGSIGMNTVQQLKSAGLGALYLGGYGSLK
jgi:hypothetical protein